MILNIKNMVCGRCKKVVTELLHDLHIKVDHVELGRVDTKQELDQNTIAALRQRLQIEGFELIDDQKVKLVEQVKNVIVNLVHYQDLDEMRVNLSEYLSNQIHRDYNYLSNLFSSLENTTIEQFFILQKIERVKEWLVYDQLTLSEMAYKLGYSSVAHLSNQFKKITGFSPTTFRHLKDHQRKPLDEV